MVKRGYRVIEAPHAGLAHMHLDAVDRLAAKDSDVLDVGYLGVAMAYTRTEKQRDAKIDVETESDTCKQSVQYVPTKAYKQICTEYSHLSSSSESSIALETSPLRKRPARDNIKENINGKTVPFLSPIAARYPMTTRVLRDTDSDFMSIASQSFDTAWSETSALDRYHSILNTDYSVELERLENTIDTDASGEFDEALETPYIDMDIETVSSETDKVKNAATGPENEDRKRIMKVRTMSDLNNERHYVRRQNAKSLDSVISNILENDLEGKQNSKENKSNNVLYQNDFAIKTAEANFPNTCTNKRGYRKGAKSIDMILDVQKYVIQKENIYNENCSNMKWHVKCFECQTTNGNSQSDLSNTSPENVPRYPLDDFYKKRQNVTSKTNRKIASLILCGCNKTKATSIKKDRKTFKRTKKSVGWFSTLGFS